MPLRRTEGTPGISRAGRAMTRHTTRRSRAIGIQREERLSHPPAASLTRWLLQREVWGLGLTAVGIVTMVTLLARNQGSLSDAWSLVLRQLFGVGAYPVALLIIASGVILLVWNMLPNPPALAWPQLVGWELFFFSGLGLIHFSAPDSARESAQAGAYGGYAGWALQQLLVPVIGRALTVVVLASAAAGGLYLATGSVWPAIYWRACAAWARLGVALRTVLALGSAGSKTRSATAAVPRVADVHDTPPWEGLSQAIPASKPHPSATPKTRKAGKQPATPMPTPPSRPARSSAGLPSVEILTPDQAGSVDDAEARARAQIIEETLDAFGIPVQVTEWHRGPVVTQYHVEPGYVEKQDRDGTSHRFKIRVAKILALANDLALALAASPIRIEAPVPGHAVVGIEVPNDVKSMVGLRGVLESPAFAKMRSPLRIALGRDVSGEPVVADLASMPHLLLAGSTGSGKSVCLNAIIASILFHNTPAQARFLMIDPKRVELTMYNGIPHLLSSVVVDIERVIAALRWVVREMEQRYRRFSEAGARNIAAFNKMARSRGLEPVPMIIVVIDELADLMLAAPEDVERALCRLAQMARATGIHLVIATQRPSVDVVTGLIKANFPARISFAVTSQVDSRVVLDTPGAEKLLGRGDMLFMAPDSPKLLRVQGCFVSDKEIAALVRFWREVALQTQPGAPEPEPWQDLLDGTGDEQDALLERAVALVREHKQASASLLQRRMGIGYPRAARLVDQLAKLGIISPAEGGGKSWVVAVDEHGDSEVAETLPTANEGAA